MASTNSLILTYAEETTPGVLPAIPKPKSLRCLSENIANSRETAISQELNLTRMTADLTVVDEKVGGPVPFEFSLGSYDEIIEAAMFSSFVELASVESSEISGISLEVFEVSAGQEAGFVIGDTFLASGFTDANNNGLFQVTAVASGQITAAGQGLTDVTESGYLHKTGHRFLSGDITATATGLASVIADFTDASFGFAVGQWIKIGSVNAAYKFSTVGNNDFARISAISANAITLDHRPLTWDIDAGAGKEISVFFGEYLRTGTVAKTFTFEKSISNQETVVYTRFTGIHLENFELNFQTGQLLGGSFSVMGLNSNLADESIWGAISVEPPSTSEVMNAVNDIPAISEAGQAIEVDTYVQQLSLGLNNALVPGPAVGHLGAVKILAGRSNPTGQLVVYFENKNLIEKQLNNDATIIVTRVERDNATYVFTYPKVKFTEAQYPTGTVDQFVTVTMPFTALLDPVTNTNMQIDRFTYFE